MFRPVRCAREDETACIGALQAAEAEAEAANQSRGEFYLYAIKKVASDLCAIES
jgi:hypothetical protein